jgi:hypothetical protein
MDSVELYPSKDIKTIFSWYRLLSARPALPLHPRRE